MTTSESRKHYPEPIALEHAELAEYRAEFPILQRKTYMNSCSLGALSNRAMQGLVQFMVATYLIPPSGNFAVAFTTVVLPVSPKVYAVEGVSAHVYR